MAQKGIKVLVVGAEHPIQRHQDTSMERELMRAKFEKFLRQVIKERNIDLIAEEAGDDVIVWKLLKWEEEAVGKFAAAFGGSKTVDAPVCTIAKKIADEGSGKLRYVDIRAAHAENMSIEERDVAMAAKVKEVLGDAGSILVVVGEGHRPGMVQRLKDGGMTVEALSFL